MLIRSGNNNLSAADFPESKYKPFPKDHIHTYPKINNPLIGNVDRGLTGIQGSRPNNEDATAMAGMEIKDFASLNQEKKNFVLEKTYKSLQEKCGNSYGAGSTGLTTVVEASREKINLTYASVGDCGCYIFTLKNGKVKDFQFINPKHNPDSEAEATRIKAAGGKIKKTRDGNRLEGSLKIEHGITEKKTQGVSRAFGDKEMIGISAEPEIGHRVLARNKDEKVIIINACDGLEEGLAYCENLRKLVEDNHEKNAAEFSRVLVDYAEMYSGDNISAAVTIVEEPPLLIPEDESALISMTEFKDANIEDKPTNLDSVIVSSMSVFDGHGGPAVAINLSENVYEVMQANIILAKNNNEFETANKQLAEEKELINGRVSLLEKIMQTHSNALSQQGIIAFMEEKRSHFCTIALASNNEKDTKAIKELGKQFGYEVECQSNPGYEQYPSQWATLSFPTYNDDNFPQTCKNLETFLQKVVSLKNVAVQESKLSSNTSAFFSSNQTSESKLKMERELALKEVDVFQDIIGTKFSDDHIKAIQDASNPRFLARNFISVALFSLEEKRAAGDGNAENLLNKAEVKKYFVDPYIKTYKTEIMTETFNSYIDNVYAHFTKGLQSKLASQGFNDLSSEILSDLDTIYKLFKPSMSTGTLEERLKNLNLYKDMVIEKTFAHLAHADQNIKNKDKRLAEFSRMLIKDVGELLNMQDNPAFQPDKISSYKLK